MPVTTMTEELTAEDLAEVLKVIYCREENALGDVYADDGGPAPERRVGLTKKSIKAALGTDVPAFMIDLALTEGEKRGLVKVSREYRTERKGRINVHRLSKLGFYFLCGYHRKLPPVTEPRE